MIFQDVQTLQTRFVDEWGAIPVFYDLQASEARPVDSIWCRFSVNPGASIHYLGGKSNGVKRRVGRIWLQIFIPAGDGSGQALEAIDAFTAIFANWSNDLIQCETETVAGPFADKETGMTMMTANIPYTSFHDY